jgi:putative intracellular protease/amidase
MTKILMVLTSHDRLGDTGRRTGFWLEELAAPYYRFKEAGWDVTLASPKGGRPPLDPTSAKPDFQTDLTRRFEEDLEAQAQLDSTVRLDEVSAADFDTVFYPGGHGPVWDLADDPVSIGLLEQFLAQTKPVALVCHAPVALRHVRTPDGSLAVAGRLVTGFTDTEEEIILAIKGLQEAGAKGEAAEVMPFLLEDDMLARGARYTKVADYGENVVTDGLLITGQNPASSGPAADVLVKTVTNGSAK